MSATGVTPGQEDLADASIWLARLRADDCTAADRERFAAWLAGDESRRGAFEAVTTAFESAGAAFDHWPRDAPEDEEALEEEAAVPGRSRRAFVLGAGALAVGAGAVSWQAAFAGTAETGFGERRALSLADGSTALLDTETNVRQPWLRDRVLELRHGRISIRTVSNPGKDFRIDTASHRITGDAIDADVSWNNSRLSVSVLRGDVSVAHGDAPAIRLRAGERLSPEGLIDRPAMDALTAWREGRLTFSDTTLEEACAELNRYDGVRLVPDAEAAKLRISGTYALGKNARFADAVTQLLPVRASARPGGIELAGIQGDASTGNE